MIYSKIAGTGRYLPERVMTNVDLEKIVETSDEWIRTRTGVERRHVADEDRNNIQPVHRSSQNRDDSGFRRARRY